MAVDLEKIKARLLGFQDPKAARKAKAEEGAFFKFKDGDAEIFRLIPDEKGDPFEQWPQHFKLEGMPVCLRAFKKRCPVCDYASELWKEAKTTPGTEEAKQDPARKAAISLFSQDKTFAKAYRRSKDGGGVVKILPISSDVGLELAKKLSNPDDWGDISDLREGNDFTIECTKNQYGFNKTKAEIRNKKSPIAPTEAEIQEIVKLANAISIRDALTIKNEDEMTELLGKFLTAKTAPSTDKFGTGGAKENRELSVKEKLERELGMEDSDTDAQPET